jgi:hypothetical protein
VAPHLRIDDPDGPQQDRLFNLSQIPSTTYLVPYIVMI